MIEKLKGQDTVGRINKNQEVTVKDIQSCPYEAESGQNGWH